MSAGQQNGAKPNNREPSSRQGSEPADWDGLKGDVSEIADAALERGRGLLGSATSQATGFVDQRKNDAAQSIVEFAQSLRESSEAFGDRPNIQGLVETAIGGLEQVADTIRDRSAAEILNDVEAMMRRRPTTVAVTALALGFVAARFIKASAEGIKDERTRQYRAQGRVGSQSQSRGIGQSGAGQAA
jgi:hypothetical protein